MTVGGVSLAWFGAGWLILSMFGWWCSLNPPVCTVSAMTYLPEILLVSIGGGLISSGVYVWLAAAWVMEPRPLSEQLYAAGQALLVIGSIAFLGTYSFVHSILFGWNPGGLLEAVEDFVFFGPPVALVLGGILLVVGLAGVPGAVSEHRLEAVKIRTKAR